MSFVDKLLKKFALSQVKRIATNWWRDNHNREIEIMDGKGIRLTEIIKYGVMIAIGILGILGFSEGAQGLPQWAVIVYGVLGWVKELQKKISA